MNAGQKRGEAGAHSGERTLTPADVLALLDREIDYANSVARRPGWTPWALLTALAALLWAVADRVDRVVEPWIVFQSMVVAMMVIEVLQLGRLVLDPSRASEEDGRVLVSSDVLEVRRPALTLELIYSGFLLWGIERYSTGLASWSSTAAFLWALLMGLWALVGLIYSAWPFPSPVGVSLTFPLRLLLQGLPVLVPALGALGYARAIAGHGVEDVRVGVMLGLTAVVLLEIARAPDAPPLVSELVELRRGISLGSISVSEGIQSTTIILRGLKLEEYVQQDARRMLRALESLRAAITDFRLVIDEINRHTILLEGGNAPDGQAWDRLLNQWEQKAKAADARSRRAERWHRQYALRLELAAGVSRFWSLPYEGQALVAEIRPRVVTIIAAYKDVLEQYRPALARLKQAMQAAGLLE